MGHTDNGKQSGNKKSKHKGKRGKHKNKTKEKKNEGNGTEDGTMQVEQFKFRGSMSSMENRHERVPSKPVIISITTPKGTKHVADQFKDELDREDALDDLPGILHEDEES